MSIFGTTLNENKKYDDIILGVRLLAEPKMMFADRIEKKEKNSPVIHGNWFD